MLNKTEIISFIKLLGPVMKKVLLLLTFSFAFGLAAVNAQSCHGSASAAATKSKSCCSDKAAKAAAGDASIEKRMDDEGAVSYVRKEADQEGNVRFVSVKFDETSNAFVNVAPASVTNSAGMTKKSCASSASAGKACCAGKSDDKACAGMAKTEGKACCASKGGKASVEQD
jgi:hypothetical protein